MPDPALLDVGIVLIPDQTVMETALLLSERFLPRADPGPSGVPQIRLSLEEQGRQIPHLSLFHARVHPHQVDEAAMELQEHLAFATRPPPAIRLSVIEVVCGPWLFWQAELSEELLGLHLEVLEAVGHVRAGNITDPGETWLSEAQRDAAIIYGFCNAGPVAYEPHVTLGYVRAGTVIAECEPAVMRPPLLAMVRLGPRGTAVEVLRAFPFKK